jgi:hypothetical protein
VERACFGCVREEIEGGRRPFIKLAGNAIKRSDELVVFSLQSKKRRFA